MKYIADEYQKISVSGPSGEVYLSRKLVKGQGFSLPYKNTKGKKIKFFTVVTEREKLTLKSSCSKKDNKRQLAIQLFELSGSAKKQPCIIAIEPLPVNTEDQQKKPAVSTATLGKDSAN